MKRNKKTTEIREEAAERKERSDIEFFFKSFARVISSPDMKTDDVGKVEEGKEVEQ